MASRDKVLIIKTGYSETLDPETSGNVSLGDVLRSTVLLHAFPPGTHQVVWLVDADAAPLLRDNPWIQRVMTVNTFTPFQLMREPFSAVINLEKDPGICAMADSVPAERHYGFAFDTAAGRPTAHQYAGNALALAQDRETRQKAGRSWEDVLFEMVGARYGGERLILGHVPDGAAVHDIGLNYRVGTKFPLKAWPADHWTRLHNVLAPAYSISWQPAVDDVAHIENYIDWVASCRLLVTNDSLGLHIAIGLGRPVVALFGPTPADALADYPNVKKLVAPGSDTCPPCDSVHCVRDSPCMPELLVDQVHDSVRTLLPPG